MADVDRAAPVDVMDRLLWRDAKHTLDRHNAPDDDGMCVWCGRLWPCAARRLAERAEAVAFGAVPSDTWSAGIDRLDVPEQRDADSVWRASVPFD